MLAKEKKLQKGKLKGKTRMDDLIFKIAGIQNLSDDDCLHKEPVMDEIKPEFSTGEKEKFFTNLLYIRDQSHVFHWQTLSYAEHNAFEAYYEKYVDLLDDLVESIIGATGIRPQINQDKIELLDYSKDNIEAFIMKTTQVMTDDFECLVDPIFSEIYNLRDEILSALQKLKYRLTLN